MSLFQKSIIRSEVQKISDSEIKEHWDAYRKFFHNKKVQLDLISIKEQGNQTTFLVKTFCNIFGYTLNEAGVDGNLFREVGKSEFADGAIKKDGEVIAVIELKSSKTKNLKDIEDQVFKYQSRYNCNYAITSNFYKLRFYINSSSEYEEFDLFNLNISRFKVLWICLSKTNLFNDLPRKLKDKSLVEEKIVTNSLYKDYSDFRKDLFKDLKNNNPFIPEIDLLNSTQKLLDRLLFIFFGEDKGLLPENLISEIIGRWQNRVDFGDLGDDEYLYHHFQNYFQLINKGRKAKNNIGEIFPYNGGLFKEDGLLNSLVISDETLKKHTLKLTSYDFESDISVNILGHIFEHSLSEIEELQNQIEGRELDKSKSKRKKDGVFYTPQYITKYIVDNTVGKLCEEKKIELNIIEDEYFKGRKGRKKNKLESLRDTLEEYRKWLLGLTICDPACGSGAFLNQVLDFLISEHNYIDELQNSLLGSGFNFPEVENSILENNLYGVDINKESVEIAKLSLWLRTAQKGRKLTSLNSNIKCGNSLIDDPEVAGEKAFNWQNEFPDVFERGGFDVVIGNPPYVSHDNIDNKNFLQKNYATYQAFADIFCFFYELGIRILKQKGLLSYITSNSFLKAEYGKPLRELFIEKTTINELINIEETQIFSDAIVNSVITTVAKSNDKKSNARIVNDIYDPKTDFWVFVENNQFLYLQSDFDNLSWNLIRPEKLKLRNKINANRLTLEELNVKIRLGLATGSNEAFVISEDKKAELIRQDIKSSELIKPLLRGRDIHRYKYELPNLYLLLTKNGIDVPNNYPAIFNHLDSFGDKFKERGAKGQHWTNLRSCSFFDDFKKEKIVWIELTDKGRFSKCVDEIYLLNSAYFLIPSQDVSIDYLLAILNSKLIEFYLKQIANTSGMGITRWINVYVKEFPIALSNKKTEVELSKLSGEMSNFITSLNRKNRAFSKYFTTIYELGKLSKKLLNWHELDFVEFINELNKAIEKTGGNKLTKSDVMEWMELFEAKNSEAQTLKREIENTDSEIDQMVYELYGLTKEEIEIVENATK